MKHLTIMAMDSEGEIVSQQTTSEEWCLSELDYHFDVLKVALYNGEIDHILIGRGPEV
jgi:hypothetical protein